MQFAMKFCSWYLKSLRNHLEIGLMIRGEILQISNVPLNDAYIDVNIANYRLSPIKALYP